MDQLDLRKDHQFCQDLGCQHLPAHFFLQNACGKCWLGSLGGCSLYPRSCSSARWRWGGRIPSALCLWPRFPSLLSLLLSREAIPAEGTCSGSAELVDLPVPAPKSTTNQSKPGLLLPRTAPATAPSMETSPGIIFSTGFRRGLCELKKTSRSKTRSASAITFPLLCSQHCCSKGISTIPWDLLLRRNQQFFWARAGTHPSCVWHLTNEAGLGELHSWTGVSKFHCSLGSRNTGPSGPRSFRAQLRAQSTKSSPLISPRAASQEYEIFHSTDVPFSHLGSLAKGGLYSRTIQWFPGWLLQELIFQTSLTAQCRLLWKSQP